MFSTAVLKNVLKALALTGAGLTLGLTGMMFYYQKHQGPRRSIASIESGYKPSRLPIGKQASAMSVEIVGPESYPSSGTEVVELVGFITQHISGDTPLTYAWHLPSAVTLVQGSLTSTLNAAPLGVAQRVSILVSGFSSEQQKLIGLSSQISKANDLLSASAVIVSRPEDTMEAKVMDLKEQSLQSRD